MCFFMLLIKIVRFIHSFTVTLKAGQNIRINRVCFMFVERSDLVADKADIIEGDCRGESNGHEITWKRERRTEEREKSKGI